MLSKDLELTLNRAYKNAQDKRHEFMTVEHLLLALLDDKSAAQVLNACAVDLSILRQDLVCLLYTSPSPRDMRRSRMPSSA